MKIAHLIWFHEFSALRIMFKNKNYLIDTNFSLAFFGSVVEKMRADSLPPHRFQHPYTYPHKHRTHKPIQMQSPYTYTHSQASYNAAKKNVELILQELWRGRRRLRFSKHSIQVVCDLNYLSYQKMLSIHCEWGNLCFSHDSAFESSFWLYLWHSYTWHVLIKA